MAVRTVGVGVELVTTIDHFNDGDDLNLCGGTNGTFAGGGATLTRTYDSGVFHGASGRSARLDYNLPAPGGFGGFVLPLAPGGGTVNLASYKSLGFWVRGNGGLEHLKIELDNASADGARNRAAVYLGDYVDGGPTTQWRRVIIPFAAFGNLDSFANVGSLVLVVERDYAEASGFDAAGTLYIDDVALMATDPAAAPLDNFEDNWDRHALGGRLGDFGSVTSVSHAFVPEAFHNAARALKTTYDVTGAVGTDFGGHYFALGGGADGLTSLPVNLSAFRYLKFWAKAGVEGNPVRFRVEIKSNAGTASAPIGGLTAAWEPYVVDMSLFPPAQLDKTSIKEFTIVFEKAVVQSQGGALQGVVYFDEFELVR